MRLNRLLICLGLIAAPAMLSAPVAAQSRLNEYTASYDVDYKGRRAARAVFAVSADGPGQYRFRSATEARGLYRLASPRPVVESSRFEVTDGNIRPLAFEYEDGSRRGEDNYSIEFDHARGQLRLTAAGQTRDLPLEDGLLDRGSLQVALTLDLAQCRQAGPYRFVDDDGLRSYYYERLEDLPAETGAGRFQTLRLAQRREGSSRSTVLWLAPELDYLPVRIEQSRDGEIETVLLLESIEGIRKRSASCPATQP